MGMLETRLNLEWHLLLFSYPPPMPFLFLFLKACQCAAGSVRLVTVWLLIADKFTRTISKHNLLDLDLPGTHVPSESSWDQHHRKIFTKPTIFLSSHFEFMCFDTMLHVFLFFQGGMPILGMSLWLDPTCDAVCHLCCRITTKGFALQFNITSPKGFDSLAFPTRPSQPFTLKHSLLVWLLVLNELQC